MKGIEFLKKLFLQNNKQQELSYSEEILGSKAKRQVFASFWKENEKEMIYLLEVLNYLEGQRMVGKDLSDFRRGMSEFLSFWRTCYEEELLDKEERKTPKKFQPHF